jgi:hypothetical protein
VANKLIDPGLYYNLKAAKEIMRKQTDKDFFGVEDGALQAPDQEKISTEDLKGLRGIYEEKQEERKLKKQEQQNKNKEKIKRKEKKEKNK